MTVPDLKLPDIARTLDDIFTPNASSKQTITNLKKLLSSHPERTFTDIIRIVFHKQLLSDLTDNGTDSIARMTTLARFAVLLIPEKITTPVLVLTLLQSALQYISPKNLRRFFDVFTEVSSSLKSLVPSMFLTWTPSKVVYFSIANALHSLAPKLDDEGFRGLILMEMNSLLPADDPTGKNMLHMINVDTETVPDGRDIDLGNEDIVIALDFYETLWDLQEFFADPLSLRKNEKNIFDQEKLSEFEKQITSVFKEFKKHKCVFSLSDEFFPKYLTSKRLCHLQLVDSSFRRNIAAQCYIICDFLLHGDERKYYQKTAADEKVLTRLFDLARRELLRAYPAKESALVEKYFHADSFGREQNIMNSRLRRSSSKLGPANETALNGTVADEEAMLQIKERDEKRSETAKRLGQWDAEDVSQSPLSRVIDFSGDGPGRDLLSKREFRSKLSYHINKWEAETNPKKSEKFRLNALKAIVREKNPLGAQFVMQVEAFKATCVEHVASLRERKSSVEVKAPKRTRAETRTSSRRGEERTTRSPGDKDEVKKRRKTTRPKRT